jgi:hypothetical protein
MDGSLDEWMGGGGGWLDGWMDESMNGWMDGWTTFREMSVLLFSREAVVTVADTLYYLFSILLTAIEIAAGIH